MDTKSFNNKNFDKSRAVCEGIEREDAERSGKLADLMDVQLKSELGRAKGSATGWEKKAEKRLKHIGECEKALAKRNERIAELEKQVADLSAELANAKVLTDRERVILGIWPKFEDGEYVWFGDETDRIVGKVIAIQFGAALVSFWNDSDDRVYMDYGERVMRPTPKVLDADGVEIKAGDTVWHEDGSEQLVEEMNRYGVRCFDGDKRRTFDPKYLTHTRPDSWERLEEDATKCDCDYFGAEDSDHCIGCPASDGKLSCWVLKSLDLIRRAKALAGVEE